VAIFAWDAARGRLVTEACWKLGLHVPEEVSVLVGYNDDLMCEISMPPLSGIDDCPEQIGHAAAELLDRMLRGEKPPTSPQYISPSGIVARQSTDTLAYSDPQLTAAVSYIRKHADTPIRVDDVLTTVTLSRRSLEQRFLQVLGRSPAAEIRRIHLQRAKELLIRSELPISKVADASGFVHAEVMTRAFRRELGISPTAFRQQFRAG
jgi:LacI family transcriptional regulator